MQFQDTILFYINGHLFLKSNKFVENRLLYNVAKLTKAFAKYL